MRDDSGERRSVALPRGMARRPYVPSGKSSPGALPILFGATLGAGVIAGIVEGFVSQWFNLLLIFPLALGLAAGGVGVAMINSRRVRNPFIAGVIGVIAGLAAQSVVHVMEYEHARSSIEDELEKEPAAREAMQAIGASAAVDLVLSGEERVMPFIGYLRMAAKHGITITRYGRSSSDPTLTGGWVYALWIVELLGAAAVAAIMMVSQAREPFCERCDAWYATEQAIAAGAGDNARIKETVRRLESGDLAAAVAGIGASDGNTAGVLFVRSCAQCTEHDPVLELRRVTGLRGKKEVKKVYSSLIAQGDLEPLRKPAQPPAA
jgi:hypothetical protein